MVYTATILAVIFGLVMVNLIGSRKHHSDMSSKIRVAITGLNVMENFGQNMQHAFDLGRFNPGACPAGTVRRVLAGQSFCLPDPNGNGAFDDADLCVGGYCVDNTLTVQNDHTGETYLTASRRSSRLEKFIAYWRTIPWSELSSTAHAQRVVHLPAPPGPGETNNAIGNPPGGNPLNKACGANIRCITLRVCPNALGCATLNQFWLQRYGFRI